MEILGYILTLIIGIMLWLTWGGWSILAVPLFVYIFHISPEHATSYSLGIVWITSLFALWPKYQSWQVDIRTGLLFGIPSLVWVMLVRNFLMPIIPDLLHIWSINITKSALIMVVFALIMLMAAWSMLSTKSNKETSTKQKYSIIQKYILIAGEGLIVWWITWFVWAGGGFLIIPALLFLTKLPIKQAIGTSLMIISIKSLLWFIGDVTHIPIEIGLFIITTIISVLGMFIGNKIQYLVNDAMLKKWFWYMIIVMWILILLKELV